VCFPPGVTHLVCAVKRDNVLRGPVIPPATICPQVGWWLYKDQNTHTHGQMDGDMNEGGGEGFAHVRHVTNTFTPVIDGSCRFVCCTWIALYTIHVLGHTNYVDVQYVRTVCKWWLFICGFIMASSHMCACMWTACSSCIQGLAVM